MSVFEEEPVFKTVVFKPRSWWNSGGHKHKIRVQSIVQMVLCKEKKLWYCNIPCGHPQVLDYKYIKKEVS